MSRSPAVRFEIASTWDGFSIPVSERVVLSVWLEEGALHLRVDAPYHGDSAPGLPPGPTPRLWDYEVVEFFLVGGGGSYIEIELGPHGHHLVLSLGGPRELLADQLPLHYESRIEGVRWTATASLSIDYLPEGPYRANACAIHGQGDERRYLSAVPLPGPEPDFHRIELFPAVDFSSDVGPLGETSRGTTGTEIGAATNWSSFSGQTEVLSVEEIETAQSLNRRERRASSHSEGSLAPRDSEADGGLLFPIAVAILFIGLITGLGTVGVQVIKYQLSGLDAADESGLEPSAEYRAERSRWISPERAEASSTRAPSKKSGEWESCYASNAIDGLRETAWCEGRPTDGLGESLTLTLAPKQLGGLRLIGSLGDPTRTNEGEEWSASNRISVLQVQTYDEAGSVIEEQLVKLGDTAGWKSFLLHGRGLVRSVVLTVVEVHPSKKSRGEIARRRLTGIAEVEVQVAEPLTGGSSGD